MSLQSTILLAVAASVIGPQAGRNEARDLLDRMAAKHKTVETMTATFVQKVKTPLMRRPIVSEGRLAYRRTPACAVFTLTKPRRSVCRFDVTSYQVYRPKRNEAERYLFTDDDLAGALVRILSPKAVAEIEKSFRVGKATPRGKDNTLREIALEPLHARVSGYMTKLALTVACDDLTVREIRYTNRDGDVVRIEVTGHEMNPKIPAAHFARTLPKGTRLKVHRVEAEKPRAGTGR